MSKKKKTEGKASRSRQFCLVLYEDDETHMKALLTIQNRFNHAMIRHDMDTYEEDVYRDGELVNKAGDLKKPHYHVVIKFENARFKSALAKELEIEENYIQVCSNIKSQLLYLIHFRDFDKYLYKVDEVTGPLKSDLILAIAKEEKDENKCVQEIYRFINNQPRPLSVTKLSKWCYENGYWDVFRRASSIFFRVLEEYNYNKDGFYPHRYYEGDDIELAFEQLGIDDINV